MIKIFH